jgi:hypothetical protein
MIQHDFEKEGSSKTLEIRRGHRRIEASWSRRREVKVGQNSGVDCSSELLRTG